MSTCWRGTFPLWLEFGVAGVKETGWVGRISRAGVCAVPMALLYRVIVPGVVHFFPLGMIFSMLMKMSSLEVPGDGGQVLNTIFK